MTQDVRIFTVTDPELGSVAHVGVDRNGRAIEAARKKYLGYPIAVVMTLPAGTDVLTARSHMNQLRTQHGLSTRANNRAAKAELPRAKVSRKQVVIVSNHSAGDVNGPARLVRVGDHFEWDRE